MFAKIINLIRRFIEHIQGERCPECGSSDLTWASNWIRGYNDLCNQATGCCGTRCFDCGLIQWDQDYEEWTSGLPSWITPYPDCGTRPTSNRLCVDGTPPDNEGTGSGKTAIGDT